MRSVPLVSWLALMCAALVACGDSGDAPGPPTESDGPRATDGGSSSADEEPESMGDGDGAGSAPNTPTTQDAENGQHTGAIPEGLNTLYIGHSFGRPFAEQLTDFSQGAGIEDHTQQIVRRGGAKGAPQALWEEPADRTEIQAVLDTGDVEVLVMICCSESFLVDSNDTGVRLWMDYALSQNPDTRFVLALPWPDFPENYANAAEHSALWGEGHERWHGFIDDLRESYPGVGVSCLPHGAATFELRERFEAGTLNDIEMLTGPAGSSLFTDMKGHAGQILRDVGTLIWLGAIYDASIADHPIGAEYDTDVIGIAETILAGDEYTR